MNKLQVLKDNQQDLLLAEVAGWLHDMGKCADEHVIHQASDAPAEHDYRYKTAYTALLNPTLTLNLLGKSIPLCKLIKDARPRVVKDTTQPWLLRVLARCHAAAHVEKEQADITGKQPQRETRLSNPFGFELWPLHGLTASLQELPFSSLTERNLFKRAVKTAFTEAPGDTRRPANEVTLWDWSNTVAALYKAALAGALLGYRPDPDELRWRFLSNRVDDTFFYERIARIPDLKARQKLLADAFERVRILLEETYPLGTLVYQDENSSLYVLPNLPDLLNLTDSQGTTLRALIHSEFSKGTIENDVRLSLAGEVVPLIEVDSRAWWAQKPDGNRSDLYDEIPPIAAILQAKVSTHADGQAVAEWWSSFIRDICPVCGLRPQGPDKKALERKVCDVCERRRADRAKEWAGDLITTIWTDEVVDVNGRLALIVGRFDLGRWLNGTMVKTLLATAPKLGAAVAKNPSFARLRRVWETTQNFWEKVRDEDIPEVVGRRAGRWCIIPDDRENIWRKSHLDLGKYHSYELVTKQGQFSVIWHHDGKYFLTADNMSRFPEPAVGDTYEIIEPTGYGSPTRAKGSVTLAFPVQEETTCYAPTIPILAYPATFMQLVPADKGLNVASKIKTRFTEEMGKVRNRLPLALGLVFFDTRTPLRAALDAGRRLLQMPLGEESWVVDRVNIEPDDEGYSWAVLQFKDDKPVWRVPISMGDKSEDKWYPYYFLESALDPSKHIRTYEYRYLDEKREEKRRNLVHLANLQPGDQVGVTPALLDFVYLDVAGRRFEVAYQQSGSKPERLDPKQRRKPYYLEQLDDLTEMWELLRKGLTTKQINDMLGLIEAKRREWQENPAVFDTFVEDTLKNADWRGGWERIEDCKKQKLIQAAQSGMLDDVRELYMEVMKQKPKAD